MRLHSQTRLTREQERELMRFLMLRRERQTPQHRDPPWIHRFWKGVGS